MICSKHQLEHCPDKACRVSVADDRMDTLVQAASVPNLADLFRKAKDAGVIGSVSNYGETA